MADRTVTVRIKAVDDFSGTVDKYNRDIKSMEDTTTQSASGISGAFGSIQSAVGGFIAGLAVDTVIQYGEQVYQLGRKMELASSTFGQLTSDIGGPDSVIEGMRTATHGTLTDLELMAGANQLLLTGVATSKEAVVDLVSQAVILGQAMGVDAPDAIANLNSAMLNMSFERLDSLGVSSATVRDRMRELKEAGLSTEEAWAQSVSEGMTSAIDDLGESATENFSQVDILLTRIENFAAGQAQGATGIIEGIAGAVNSILDDTNQNPEVGHEINAEEFLPLTSIWDALLENRKVLKSRWAVTIDEITSDIESAWSTAMSTGMTQYTDSIFPRTVSQNIGESVNAAVQIQMQPRGRGEVDYYTQDQVDALALLRSHAEESFLAIKDMHDQEIVSDEQYAQLEQEVDFLNRAEDAARRGLEALQKLDDSTSNLFSQGGGGALGQMGDQITQYMESQGFSDEMVSSLGDAFNFASGRETEISQAWEEEGLPAIAAIAEQHGEQAAVIAAENFMAGIINARAAGVAAPSMADLLGYADVGGEQMGIGELQDIHAGSGWGSSFGGESAESGAPVGPDLSGMATDVSSMATDSGTFSSNMQAMVEPMATVAIDALKGQGLMGKMSEASGKLKDDLADISGKIVDVKFKVSADTSDLPDLFRAFVDARFMELMGASQGASNGQVNGSYTPSPR